MEILIVLGVLAWLVWIFRKKGQKPGRPVLSSNRFQESPQPPADAKAMNSLERRNPPAPVVKPVASTEPLYRDVVAAVMTMPETVERPRPQSNVAAQPSRPRPAGGVSLFRAGQSPLILKRHPRGRFIVLDFETTGLMPAQGARVIEVSAREIVDGESGANYAP